MAVQDVVSKREHRLVLTGALTPATRPLLDAILRRVIGGGSAAVVLDMRRVGFASSIGLHTVLNARALCRRHGCALRLVGGSGQVHRLFALTDVMDERSPQTPVQTPARFQSAQRAE